MDDSTDSRSEFTKALEKVCRLFIDQGTTEIMARDVAQDLEGYDSQKIGGALWSHTGERDFPRNMKSVDVELLREEGGTNVYRIYREDG